MSNIDRFPKSNQDVEGEVVGNKGAFVIELRIRRQNWEHVTVGEAQRADMLISDGRQ